METEKSPENLSELKQFAEKYRPQIEKAMREYLPFLPPNLGSEFKMILENALFSQNDQLNSQLTLLGAELLGGKAEAVLPAAAAVEYVHACARILAESKIFNGKTENSGSQAEENRILAAIALLNAAYPLVFVNHIGMPERAMQAHQEIVECVAASGIVGSLAVSPGQNEAILPDDPKESALIRLSLRVGAILSGADYLDLAALSRFAENLGDAVQISDRLKETNDMKVEPEPNSAVRNNSPELHLENLIRDSKRLLIENFQSNSARSSLIQLLDSFAISDAANT